MRFFFFTANQFQESAYTPRTRLPQYDLLITYYLTLVQRAVEHIRTPLVRRTDFFVADAHHAVQPIVRRLHGSYYNNTDKSHGGKYRTTNRNSN